MQVERPDGRQEATEMYVKGLIRFGLPVAVLLLTVAGCAQPPNEEITGARTALEQAKSADVTDYAPESLATARDAEAALDAEIRAQEEKMSILRSYDKTTELAKQAKAAADQAVADAATAKEAARAEASALIAESRTRLDEAKAMLQSAPRGKASATDIAALQGDLNSAEAMLGEAQAAFDAGNYRDATVKVQAMRQTTDEVQAAIEAAKQAQQAARPRKG
jgi:hypothetical protein